MTIKDLVKDKNVHFQYYCEGNFIYKTDCGFEFPVPLTDIGNATLKNTDKAIFMMRYIRKFLESCENAPTIPDDRKL